MRKPKPSLNKQLLLAERAHAMRHAPSWPEQVLYRHLSAGKLGVTFRRQVPIAGRYIVDFLAPSVRLVVEVDGAGHAERRAADARRDRVLRRLGYRVLRLPAQLVLRQPEVAVDRVREVVVV